jgi:hypothetical protein
MRLHLPALLVLGFSLAGCGRDADSVSPAQSDPRNADPTAEGTTMDMGLEAGTSASDTTGTGSSVGDSGVPATMGDNTTVTPGQTPTGSPPY